MRRAGTAIGRRNGHAGSADAAAAPRSLRCAIYCRKSVEERTATDFGSIEAQRESCEAFVKSQVSQGWTAVPHRYDDEGFTGANTDRPALAAMLADLEAGQIDVVVVYKIDRLSRSIADFVRLTALFDRHDVAFVSVTQQFNTATSVGRLTLNLLTVFASFEREQIAERTRDKMRAARRRGKFTGGAILLGYDRHPEGRRLVVNETEAERVRDLFALYLERGSLTLVTAEADARGWTTKSWVNRAGEKVPERPITRGYVRALLRNPAYIGKVHIDGGVYDAEHPPIVAPDVFARVQAGLAENGRTGGRQVRNKNHMLLTGIIRCASCDRPMVPTYTNRRGRQYRYYVCRRTRTEGWAACPTKSVAATEVEGLVVEQIRAVGQDPEVQARVLRAVQEQAGDAPVKAAELRRALTLWDEVWAVLNAREQARLVGLLVDAARYDGPEGTLALTFRATGIRALAVEAGA